jgi:hypothetical protein
MIKNIYRLLGSVFLATFSLIQGAQAVVGTPPISGIGFALQDGQWLRGLAGGQNYAFINSLIAAGSAQSSATQLPPGYALYEIDTVASGTGVALPPCAQGTSISLYNNGANSLQVYPSIANNPATQSQDTINGTTSEAVGVNIPELFSCAKNGIWGSQ